MLTIKSHWVTDMGLTEATFSEQLFVLGGCSSYVHGIFPHGFQVQFAGRLIGLSSLSSCTITGDQHKKASDEFREKSPWH